MFAELRLLPLVGGDESNKKGRETS